MINDVEEGKNIFQKEVMNHIIETNKAHNKEKSYREEIGRDYEGIMDWPKDEYDAFCERMAQLRGMAKVLGLSLDQVKSIVEDPLMPGYCGNLENFEYNLLHSKT